MQPMYYIGLDVHKQKISYCVKDSSGKIYAEGWIPATRFDLDRWMKTLPQPWSAALEATMFSGWIYDHLKPHAAELKVAHPLMLRAIAAAKKKNDRIDANKICDCLRCDFLPECYMAPTAIRACGFVNLTESERRRFVAEAGDILLARAIGSEEHLGKLSICRPHAGVLTFDSHVMRLRVDPGRLLPQFLASMLWSPGGRRLFMRQARRTAVQFNVNAEQISKLPIPLPALSKQERFVSLVEQADRLRAVQREALRQAEHFFAALLHSAFNG